jgi:kynurenine 3-monooxygenase
VVGGDGAGSVVRKALVDQVAGFTVETRSFPNYCTMIELDRAASSVSGVHASSS